MVSFQLLLRFFFLFISSVLREVFREGGREGRGVGRGRLDSIQRQNCDAILTSSKAMPTLLPPLILFSSLSSLSYFPVLFLDNISLRPFAPFPLPSCYHAYISFSLFYSFLLFVIRHFHSFYPFSYLSSPFLSLSHRNRLSLLSLSPILPFLISFFLPFLTISTSCPSSFLLSSPLPIP